jgi:Mycothiol maleylpyruvate isomerase N-terminal domain
VSKAEFLAGIRGARVELAHVLGSRDERTLAETAVPGLSWTSKELLAHLIGYDLAVLTAIADVRAGRKWKWGWTDPGFDAWNESQVAPRRGRSYAAVRAELDASRTGLLVELEGWPEDAGPFGPDTWDATKSEISWIGPHEREHAEMIAKL